MDESRVQPSHRALTRLDIGHPSRLEPRVDRAPGSDNDDLVEDRPEHRYRTLEKRSTFELDQRLVPAQTPTRAAGQHGSHDPFDPLRLLAHPKPLRMLANAQIDGLEYAPRSDRVGVLPSLWVNSSEDESRRGTS